MNATSFRVNKQVKDMISQLALKEGRSTRASIHRRAIESFYNSADKKVHPRLLIVKHKDPDYVYRGEREQVYVDDEMQRMIDELVELNGGCTPGTIVFHALLVYVTKELSK